MLQQNQRTKMFKLRTSIMTQYPQRDKKSNFQDYLHNQKCKYGYSCEYYHPISESKTTSHPREPPFQTDPNELP